MYIILFIIINLIFSYFISLIGKKREIGSTNSFLISFFLSPIMGLLFTIASPLLENKRMLQSILDEIRELKNPKGGDIPKEDNSKNSEQIKDVPDILEKQVEQNKIKPTTLEEDEKNSPKIEVYVVLILVIILVVIYFISKT